MTAPVDICNLALQRLGEPGNLVSIDPPDDNQRARDCALVYEPARDAVLQDHPWNFASTRVSLAKLATAPAFDFANAYAVPSDALIVRWVRDEEDYPWRVELQGGARVIATDLSTPIKAIYTARVTDSNLFSPLFVQALAAYIAWTIADTVGASAARKQQAFNDYLSIKGQAGMADVKEGVPDEEPEDDWVKARR